jgi:hypothetical protein
MTEALFDYEPGPTRVSVVGVERRDGVEVAEIRFDGGSAGEAAAIVARPPASNERARGGVVLAHGGYEGGKHLFAAEAVELARHGFVALASDVSLPRLPDADAYERALAAAVVQHRRAFDVLESDYRATALAFYGHSAGGAQGAILAAVDPRARALVIAAMGAGLIVRVARELLGGQEAERIARLDPAAWVGRPASRALLVQHGRLDDVVDAAGARELYELAARPKEWAEYDCGHGVDGHPPARADRIAFLERVLA